MIEVEQLSKRYGDRSAVDGVSFQVGRGEIVGFLGPNGAGKTTTLRMITGFLTPTEGKVRVDGVDVVAAPLEARRRIGYMPEGVPLYPEMRVQEYLAYRAALKGVPRRNAGKRVDASLELAGVQDARERIIGQLSKGYRQRVGLADALVADPPLLILDEPTAGLDPNQIRSVRELIRKLSGDKTIFLSTHILPEVEGTCDRVVIINRGKLVGEGAPDTLRGGSREGEDQVVVLSGKGTEAEFRGALQDLPSVREIVEASQPSQGVTRLRVRVAAGPEAVEDVFRAIAAAGLALRELSHGEVPLEAVFAELTTEEPSPPGAEP